MRMVTAKLYQSKSRQQKSELSKNLKCVEAETERMANIDDQVALL